MTKPLKTNRRRALHRLTGLSVASAALGAGAMNGRLALMGNALAASADYAQLSDYKALVCVFLYGGADSFNMFVPLDEQLNAAYTSARGPLALPRASLLPDAQSQIGFNPQLSGVRSLYDTGKLALVGNVGNLIAPVTRAQFEAGGAAIPADLFAHNHQQEQWLKGLSSRPASLVDAGWGGRMADLLQTANPQGALPPTFSLNGTNDFLPGVSTTPISVNPVSGPRLLGYFDRNSSRLNDPRDATLTRILEQSNGHRIKDFAASSFLRARDSSRVIAGALDAGPTLATPFDQSSGVATQLRMAARLIAARQTFGMKRQVFFVGMGGWDTHDNQSPRLVELTRELDDALVSFQSTLAELNVEQQVTTFTASDFGRTLTINRDGTDHGWGGHYLVMGGAVAGGQFVGQWPDYAINGQQDAGDKGRIIPQLSINEYGAALGSWFGLSDGDLRDMFPDLTNFDDDWRNRYGLFS